MRRFKILLALLAGTRTVNDFLSPRRSAGRGRLVRVPGCRLVLATLLSAPAWNAPANNSVHTSWLWHLHQPIYWPDRRNDGVDHYENAWDTIQQQDGGRRHPSPEILRNIFGLDDRRNAYQSGPSKSLNSILAYPKSGVQISYSGALMENVQSLGSAGQLGYGGNWYQRNRTARPWTTSIGKPRMDLVNFTYHHALAPLISDETRWRWNCASTNARWKFSGRPRPRRRAAIFPPKPVSPSA
jgi:hypothetical protein